MFPHTQISTNASRILMGMNIPADAGLMRHIFGFVTAHMIAAEKEVFSI
jgi:hypothetical protein